MKAPLGVRDSLAGLLPESNAIPSFNPPIGLHAANPNRHVPALSGPKWPDKRDQPGYSGTYRDNNKIFFSGNETRRFWKGLLTRFRGRDSLIFNHAQNDSNILKISNSQELVLL